MPNPGSRSYARLANELTVWRKPVALTERAFGRIQINSGATILRQRVMRAHEIISSRVKLPSLSQALEAYAQSSLFSMISTVAHFSFMHPAAVRSWQKIPGN